MTRLLVPFIAGAGLVLASSFTLAIIAGAI